jgi:hypothetical protein
MKHARLVPLAVLATAVALAAPAVAQAANEVTKWNEIAVNTINAPTQPPIVSAPPAGTVFVAMVQGAVYGAVNAVDRHGKPYLINRRFPKASADAAAATAAYKVLSALFPSGALDDAYAVSLDGIDDGAAKDKGIRVGTKAADAMLAEGHDGRAGQFGCAFLPTPIAGVWEPLPGPTGAPACDPTTWVANAKPFILSSPSQFRSAGPYSLTSPEYAADYNEVMEIGSLNSLSRTSDETHAAAFWQTNPAANYNALARRLVDRFGLGLSDSARLFAMLDLSAADAIINTWNDKYHYRFWRPIAAIRQIGVDDGNSDTLADPTWTPLFSAGFPTSPPLPASPLPIGGVGGPLGTPPYPDHVSGATANASASMHALATFFGTDEMSPPFYLTSGRFPGEQRFFSRFSDVTNEIVEARIWAGIHFRNADVQAAKLGRDVERYVHETQFDFVP